LDGNGNYQITSITNGGSGYEPDDTITVSGNSLGGTSPANDLTITVDNLAGAILHIDNITVTRTDEPPTIIEGIDISTENAAIEAMTVIADAIKQIQFRDSYLASKESALQNSLNAISAQTASSDLLITDLAVTETVRQLKKFDVINALLSNVQKAKYLVNSGLLKLI